MATVNDGTTPRASHCFSTYTCCLLCRRNHNSSRSLCALQAQAGSRTERVRMIAGVLETLRQIEAGPGPHSERSALLPILLALPAAPCPLHVCRCRL